MDLTKTYLNLKQLNEEEQIGYAYYEKTGDYLSYISMMYLMQQENPLDLSQLNSSEAKEFSKEIFKKFDKKLSGVLNEQFFVGKDKNVKIRRLPRYIESPPHRHDFFEMVYLLSGNCLHRVEGTETRMAKGDLTIISPNVLHYLYSESNHDSIVLTIKIRQSTFDNVFSRLMSSGTILSAFFSKTLYAKNYRNIITLNCGEDNFIAELFLHMYTQQIEGKQHNKHIQEGLISVLFPYLVQNYEDHIKIPEGENPLSKAMIEIENYIRQNYKTATLAGTADHFNFNPSYLSRRIKEQTGFTFSYILRNLRMQKASELLLETDLKLDLVCEKIGYSDTTQFIKNFKEFYGMTPNNFRKTKNI
ncbi:MAG: AraC family transcriptional regulator [Clostridiales bacterium]|nr:AraC family transcriptional regulator [Clostridiales bacterium]